MNMVIIRGLMQLHQYCGDNLKVESPTGPGNEMNLSEVANEIGRRLAAIFTRGDDGHRPVFGGIERFQSDPHWRELLQFHEYFHGDNGAGLGANCETQDGPQRALADPACDTAPRPDPPQEPEFRQRTWRAPLLRRYA